MDANTRQNLIVDDAEAGTFRINREVFTDRAILEEEWREIFDRCWLYAGHVTELKNKGDFFTRKVGGRPLLFTRTADGTVRALLNSCTHRGNLVCQEHKGNARSFTCFYHAWTYSNTGDLVGVPDEAGYGPSFRKPEMGLAPAPRFEIYRGLMFVCFDRDAVDLVTYLGEVREYMDYMLDQADEECEIMEGVQEFSMHANWKLLVENSMDPYHAISTHRRYFQEFLPDMGFNTAEWSDYRPGVGIALKNGHALIENPVRPTPLTESAPEELARIRARLVDKYGPERASKVADFYRNIFVFPNLMMISMWGSLRTFYPTAIDHVEISEWALLPVTETAALRQTRLENFMSFLGPAGFGAPDDVAALEGCQRGFATRREVAWSDISRGMLQGEDGRHKLATYELQQRSFWRRWRDRLNGRKGDTDTRDRALQRNAAE